jgi:diguanylate cyclase (GGDEF)-like protein
MRPMGDSPRLESPSKRPRRVSVWLYTLAGVVLGVGAPAGALLLRVATGTRDPSAELRSNAFFYLYELVGTCAVFGAAGFAAGLRAEKLRRGRDHFQELSKRDPLTGLANAQAFQDHYRRSVDRSERFGEPVSLLLLDVDKLKGINDRFGHSCGSAALVHVAGALNACKRADDVAARWGGDEFTLLMPGADAAAARRQGQSILDRLAQAPLQHGGLSHAITVTIGAASLTAEGQGGNLFDRADAARYRGKLVGAGRLEEAEI